MQMDIAHHIYSLQQRIHKILTFHISHAHYLSSKCFEMTKLREKVYAYVGSKHET